MKKISPLLLLLAFVVFFTLPAFAQQDFQGKIRYRVVRLTHYHGDDNDKDSAIMITLHLSPNRILFTVDKSEEENILIMLDSLKIFEINKEEKTYRESLIPILPPLPAETETTIAGYSTRVTQQTLPESVTRAYRSTSWINEQLTYHLPEGVYIREFMMFFQNHYILLQSKLSLRELEYNRMDEEEAAELKARAGQPYDIKITAEEVIPGALPASIFELPAGYVKEPKYYPPSAMDTVIIRDIPDSAAMDEPPPPPPPTKPKQPSKAPVKKPGSGTPARKPD